jgi:hypothetical protein
MTLYRKWAIACAILLGSTMGVATASSEAHAGSKTGDAAAVLKGDHCCTKYLCQKKDQYGCWYTCHVCYDYNQAMSWYDQQDGNARVLASK